MRHDSISGSRARKQAGRGDVNSGCGSAELVPCGAAT
jgi:hypothetical protein